MKKVIALLLVFIMVFSLCGCGKKVSVEDIEYALKDADYWECVSDVSGLKISQCYVFSDNGSVTYLTFVDNKLGFGHRGTYSIDLEEDTIDIIFNGKIDNKQNTTVLGAEDWVFETIYYSFEDEVLRLNYPSDRANGAELQKVG